MNALAPLLLGHVVLACGISAHALLHKRDPRSAWAWITVAWLCPVVGPLFYWWFGINRIERRARRELGASKPLRDGASDSPLPRFEGAAQDEVNELARLGRAISGRPLLAGNAVDVLNDGDEAYPAMLEAIRRARTSAWLESYIFDSGTVGEQFAAVLADAVARGVQVRVLVDGVGDLARGIRGSALLHRHGIPVHRFLPPRLFPPLLHINLRNHRKLLCVDGEVAFVGGINIGDHHILGRIAARATGRALREPTADLHFRVTGPVVTQLEEVFADDWHATTGEALPASVAAPVADGARCRALATGPNDDQDRLQLLLLGALANAHRRVQIMTPYFVPSPELSGALRSAAMRGVEITLMLPQRSDHPVLDAAARRWLDGTLGTQIRVLWRPAPFAHSKMFLVDGYYALVGSANFDARSLRLNFELQLEIYDADVVHRLAAQFEAAARSCKRLDVVALQARPLLPRLRDAMSWLLSPYL